MKHNSSLPAAVVAADPAFVKRTARPRIRRPDVVVVEGALFNRMVAAGEAALTA
ncbi:MAG: hypothetical protein IPH41_10905 [Sulfuritalea sp.]|nr:hypothetical protein [Sulfuritalea sp.]